MMSERRIHQVFVTRNTEYHVKRDVCVAVRDRRSGEWLRAHLAHGHLVDGALRFQPTGGVTPNGGKPRIGDSLFFHAEGRDLVTSAIVSVERPPRDVIAQYD
jgi:hypothetical protein